MAAIVRRSDVVEQPHMQPDEWTLYLDKRTGKYLTHTDEMERGLGDDAVGLVDWHREELAELEEAEQTESLDEGAVEHPPVVLQFFQTHLRDIHAISYICAR